MQNIAIFKFSTILMNWHGDTANNVAFDVDLHLGEGLTDVEHRWSGDRVSEVRGGEQQRSHFQVDQLKIYKHTVGVSDSQSRTD